MEGNTSPMTDDGLEFDSLEDDFERFEYAQYIINTTPEERPEVSKESEEAALKWMEDSRTP